MSEGSNTLQKLETFWVRGQTEKILEATEFSHQHGPDAPEELAYRGWAHLLRGDWDMAEWVFRYIAAEGDEIVAEALSNVRNTRAILGLAHLAAQVRSSYSIVQSLIKRLPSGLTRDTLEVICARCREHVADVKIEDRVDEIVQRYESEINPSDPFGVAQLFTNAVHFYRAQPESCGHDNGFRCQWCSGLLTSALALYGTGSGYLSYRAQAHHLISTMQEVRGPATALPSAEEAVGLWFNQVKLDPPNNSFKHSFEVACKRALSLAGQVHELWAQDKTNDHLEDMVQRTHALVMRARHELGTSDP